MSDTDIVKIDEQSLIEKFTDRAEIEKLIDSVADVVGKFEHDLTTDAGRKRSKSLAAKVSRVKTRVDGIGKELVAGWKARAKEVDINRKFLRESLDDLRDEARRPVDDYEAEQVRIAAEKLAEQKRRELLEQIERDHEFALLLNEKHDAEVEAKRKEAIEKAREAQRLRDAEIEQARREAAEKASREAEEKAQREVERAQAQVAAERERAERAQREAERQAEQIAEQKRVAEEEKRREECRQAEIAANHARLRKNAIHNLAAAARSCSLIDFITMLVDGELTGVTVDLLEYEEKR